MAGGDTGGVGGGQLKHLAAKTILDMEGTSEHNSSVGVCVGVSYKGLE